VTWYAQVWNAMMIFGEDLYIVYQPLHCTMTVVWIALAAELQRNVLIK